MDIYQSIERLIEYAQTRNLISGEDEIWARNRVLDILELDSFEESKGESRDSLLVLSAESEVSIDSILEEIVDYAVSKGLIEGDVESRDILDTRIMEVFTDRPSLITDKFESFKKPQKATEWFYSYCKDINYIRSGRIARDRRWKVKSPYGDIDITINLAKPEKDPKAIAMAGKAPGLDYPKCQLCLENMGYAGRIGHPARANLRIIPMEIAGEEWGFQYSPYSYYNEHCILLNSKHVPMRINEKTFRKMFAFIDRLPHYFVGSNADLPIVGGSILSHDHFQGGRYTFAIEEAGVQRKFKIPGFEDVKAEVLTWPLSVIRIRHKDSRRLVETATHILSAWRSYSDEEAGILAVTGNTLHNTITPIARRKRRKYELDLILRNNRTTPEYPMGIFHPHEEYHHIKKENIGLIEAMGLAVLPARLDKEMSALSDILVNNKARGKALREVIANVPDLEKHAEWAAAFASKHRRITEDNVDRIIESEIGKVFVHVLEDAGVFKCDKAGREYFKRFTDSL